MMNFLKQMSYKLIDTYEKNIRKRVREQNTFIQHPRITY